MGTDQSNDIQPKKWKFSHNNKVILRQMSISPEIWLNPLLLSDENQKKLI